MRKSIIWIVVLMCVTACSKQEAEAPEPIAAATPQSESERLNAWFEERYEEQMQFSPAQLTFIGRKDRYDELDDASEQAEDLQLEWQRQTVETMEREFDYAALTPDAQISYDIWKYQYEEALADREFRGNSYLFTQFFGPQAFIPTFMSNFHRVDEAGDMDAYIKRISEAARLLNQLLGSKRGPSSRGRHSRRAMILPSGRTRIERSMGLWKRKRSRPTRRMPSGGLPGQRWSGISRRSMRA
jgi:uncharacterized protein (DUF885 family)